MPDSRWKLISIRTLCGEGDPLAPRSTLTRKLFLSTPSARRATAEAGKMVVGANHFYPRPPRGGRQWGLDLRYFYCGISIHALREEGDTRAILTPTPGTDFYPRPPRGGRLHGDAESQSGMDISIHALREEGDPQPTTVGIACLNFYPRPPRGGRLQLTNGKRAAIPISIHALREEGDVSVPVRYSSFLNFYPRPPRGGRRLCASEIQFFFEFLSTPSAGRATLSCGGVISAGEISIHALREEGDLSGGAYTTHRLNFYPRPPRGGRRGRSNKPQKNNDFYPRPPRGGRRLCPRPCVVLAHISIHALREEGDML